MERSKKLAFGFLGFMAFLLFILFIGGLIAKKQIKNGLQESLGEQVDWEELDVKVFRKRISMKEPAFQLGSSTVQVQRVVIKDFSYFQYLFNDRIEIGEIEIDAPDILISRDSRDSTKSEDKNKGLQREVLIGSVKITNGSLKMPGQQEGYPLLSLIVNRAELQEVRIDSASLQKRLPFDYSGYDIQLDSIQSELDSRHDLLVNSFTGRNGELQLDEICIIPRYDKVEFQKETPFERDRVELTVDSANITGFTWDFERDTLKLEASGSSISGADVEIYRNKLKPEDIRKKPLYSEMLRNLPVKLRFPRIEVRDGNIKYEEKTEANNPPGTVSFHNVRADIENLTNVGLHREDFPQTTVNAEATFHDHSPVTLEMVFDVSNLNEKFTASGTLEQITPEAINAFVRPTVGVEAQGGIDYFAFTFTGNDDFATGDVRTRYEDFRIHILEEDGSEKKAFWSAIVNLFINNDAVTDDVVHKDLKVERDKKRSFWNFLWLCIREGALSSFL